MQCQILFKTTEISNLLCYYEISAKIIMSNQRCKNYAYFWAVVAVCWCMTVPQTVLTDECCKQDAMQCKIMDDFVCALLHSCVCASLGEKLA